MAPLDSEQLTPMAMETGHEPDEEAFSHYIAQAQVTAQVIGGDATGGARSFVPMDALRGPPGFFSEDVIRRLLDYYGNDAQTHWERVHKSFLAVFSILITIGKASYLHQFTRKLKLTDKDLPFTSKDAWHNDCHYFFDEFYRAQWKFCAQPFATDWMNETRLDDPNIILPIIDQRCLKHGPDAYTYWIKLHPTYDQIHGHPSTNEYLLKTCKREHTKLHRNEVGAYRTLCRHPEIRPYLPRFYGSWTIGDTYYMLLEYVEGGTLTHFLEDHHPPEGPEELLRFWRALLETAIPVMWIHSLPVSGETHLDLQGIHHDIKTDNILVKFNDTTSDVPESQCRFDVVLKLADLGLADIINISNEKTNVMRDKPGTQTYSSPENFVDENDEIHYRTARKAEPSKDIWALGCVWSQALVWSVLGQKGLTDYQAARITEISTIRELRHSAYSECYHDGVQVLNAVSTYHTKACRSKRDFDKFVPRVQGLIQMMLCPVKDRLSAYQVRAHSSRILQDVENLLYPSFWQTPSPYSDSQATMPGWSPETNLKGLGMVGVKDSVDAHSLVTGYVSPKHAHHTTPYSSRSLHKTIPPELPSRHLGSTPGPSSHNRDSRSRNSIGSIAQTCASAPFKIQHPREGSNCVAIHEEGTVGAVQHDRRLSNEVGPIFDPRRRTVLGTFPKESTEPRNHKHQNSASAPVLTAGLTSPGLPTMSIDEVINWIGQTKDKSTVFPHNGDMWLNKLKARDQIFLIDDSETMRPYWDDVKRAFQALAYLVKRSDYDGIELRFTNNIAVEQCAKHRKPLMATLSSIHPGGKCDIGLTFGKIIHGINLETNSQAKKWTISRRFKKKKKWGTNIYIFTNGTWENESDWLDGIVDPLKKLISNGVQKREVGVQFIQFGNDPNGTARLKELDNQLAQYGVERDMVDTTHVSGNVFKMLLGSFDPNWDHYESPRISASPVFISDPIKANDLSV